MAANCSRGGSRLQAERFWAATLREMMRIHMTTRAIRPAALGLLLLMPLLLSARQAPPPGGDMIDRIFKAREFAARPALQPQWIEGGAAYVLIEPSAAAAHGMEVVKYDSATGSRRE